MNDEHQLSIGYTYYIKGTETKVYPTVNVTLDRFDSNIGLSNYIDNYGTYTYTFNVDDKNFDSFSTRVNFDIYIAKLTTSTSLDHDTNGGTAYTSLDEAIIASQDAQESSHIYVYGDAVIGELDDELTLGTNTELYLPHNASVTERLDYNPPTGKSNAALDVNNVQISSTITKYITITILEGTQLTVNGAFTIGADRGQNAGASGSGSIEADTRSGYSEVILEDNVQVIVNGFIRCYGYIRGTGEIIANSGAGIDEPFVITDWPGATKAGGVYGGKNSNRNENNRVPFSQFEVRHIEVKTTIKHGANLIGLVAIYTSKQTVSIPLIGDITIDARWNTTTYPLIGTGAILEATDSNSCIVVDYNDITEQTNIQIFGNVMDNYGSLDVSVIKGVLDLQMSTQNLYFPISYKMDIEVMPGATFNINQKYKMMPGSEFYVHQGATVNVNGAIIVYKNYTDKNTGIPLYPSTYPNAKFTNAGTVIVNGGLAGVILGEDDAILDLSNASSLNLISKEGISSAGAADLLGSTEMDTFSAVQNLYAYNVSANSVSVDWSSINLGDSPSILNSYKLEKKQYVWNGSMWVENIFSVNIDSNIDYGESSITGSFGTVINENNLPIPVGTTIQIDNVFYSLEGYYTDSTYNNKLSSITISTSSITIYAKWVVSEKNIYSITFTDVLGNQTVEYYTEGSTVTLPTQTYSETKTIYSNATTYNEYFIINGSAYTINGYNESGYEYGGQIVISSNINLTMNFVKETDYYMIDIYKCDVDWKGSVSSTYETSIYMFKQNSLNINELLGHACYDKPAKGKLSWSGWQLNWSNCSQTIDLNSNTSVYYG